MWSFGDSGGDAAGSDSPAGAYFVPQGWVAVCAFIVAMLVEVVAVQVKHMSTAVPTAVMEKEVQVAHLQRLGKAINPKEEFVRWAKVTRQAGVVSKQLEAMKRGTCATPVLAHYHNLTPVAPADCMPSVSVMQLQKLLRFKVRLLRRVC